MTPERWENVEDIFNAALDRSIDEREAFLTEACGDDPSLRRQVEYLINCYEQAGDFIESPAGHHDSPMRDEAATLQSKGLGDLTSNTNEKVIGLDGVAVIVNDANGIDSLRKD